MNKIVNTYLDFDQNKTLLLCFNAIYELVLLLGDSIGIALSSVIIRIRYSHFRCLD